MSVAIRFIANDSDISRSSILLERKHKNFHLYEAEQETLKQLKQMPVESLHTEAAEQQFKRVFQQNSLPEDIATVHWKGGQTTPIIDLLVTLELLPSKSEVRRMIQNGGVKINGEKAENIHADIQVLPQLTIQVGKRKFVRLTVSE